MIQNLNIDSLVKTYQQKNNLTEGEAAKRFLFMLGLIEGKYPRLSIVGVRIAQGTIRFKLENGIVFRFHANEQVPIEELPANRTSKRGTWHKTMYYRDTDWYLVTDVEELIERIRARTPEIFHREDLQASSKEFQELMSIRDMATQDVRFAETDSPYHQVLALINEVMSG
jgi:hypothetical protein